MVDQLEQLIDSLLWEGYALYPYTAGATKNATPTPFGIVYPPAYAATLPSTFDHLGLRCTVEARADAVVRAELRFLVSGGEGHRGTAQRLELPGVMIGALAAGSDADAVSKQASVGAGFGALTVALRLSADESQPGVYELEMRVQNRTAAEPGLDRAGALTRSLISTHPLLRIVGGRFRSPLDRKYDSVNTFPVLASDEDDALLGATIVLPDHPRIAPESNGSLFDATEIEEALILHLRTLSDEERAQIERDGDPAVLAMLTRAAAAGPDQILALHGRSVLRDPGGLRSPETLTPPREPPGLVDPRAGEATVDLGGKTFRQGGKVVIRPGPDTDVHARMLDGRVATVERIFTAYDGQVHLGVTVDDDPGQDLMRETGRYLYFFEPELEVVGT